MGGARGEEVDGGCLVGGKSFGVWIRVMPITIKLAKLLAFSSP